MGVHYVPQGYHTVTPYLIIRGAADAIEFYKAALRATEVMRLPMGEGKIAHAEIKVGDSHIMLADEFPDMGAVAPAALGGTTVGLCVYLPDVDAAVARFAQAGGKILSPVQDQFYGDRTGTLLDPFGHKWTLATHIEDVSVEQVMERMAKMFGPGQS